MNLSSVYSEILSSLYPISLSSPNPLPYPILTQSPCLSLSNDHILSLFTTLSPPKILSFLVQQLYLSFSFHDSISSNGPVHFLSHDSRNIPIHLSPNDSAHKLSPNPVYFLSNGSIYFPITISLFNPHISTLSIVYKYI